MITLPFDLTGTRATNLKSINFDPIDVLGKGYVAVFEWGPFYTDSFKLYDKNNSPLVYKKDYNFGYLYEELSLITSNEIMGILLISPDVEGPFKAVIQFVGGEEYPSPTKIAESIPNILDSTEYKFSFWDILNRPHEFIPSKHTHELWEMLEMSGTVNAIDSINQALIDHVENQQAIVTTLFQRNMMLLDETERTLIFIDNALSEHVDDFNNPHFDTKAKIGLGDIDNYQLVSKRNWFNVQCDDQFMSSEAVVANILKLNPLIDDHIKSDNHDLTISQIGGLTKGQWTVEFNRYYQDNSTVVNSYRLNGKTIEQLYIDLSEDLNVNEILLTNVPATALGKTNGGTATSNVLNADNQYVPWISLLDKHNFPLNNFIYLGYRVNKNDHLSYLNTVHSNSKENTYAIGNIKDSLETLPYTNQGTPIDILSKIIGDLVIYVKRNNNWSEL